MRTLFIHTPDAKVGALEVPPGVFIMPDSLAILEKNGFAVFIYDSILTVTQEEEDYARLVLALVEVIRKQNENESS